LRFQSPAVVSDNQRKAPQEIFEPGTLKKREEMTQEEKKSARRLHKARRKNRLHNLLVRVPFFNVLVNGSQ
jgi:predicted transposase YdaD